MFQFLIGSLEATPSYKRTVFPKFQFLIGSLEAATGLETLDASDRFQFLIGSLEARLSLTRGKDSKVSIPHR